jgi:adenosylmethionine-8-amino-7-oxononanoate aminotransferase
MTLGEKDKKYIWHPYTQEKTAIDNIIMVRGEGAHLYDEDGNRYIDGTSSWWTNMHGHAHPYIAQKIAEQARKLEQVIFSGFSHEPAIHLAERLLRILPVGYEKVFYSDNGSTAIEAALKMALQYWKNNGAERSKIICFRDAYHGDTFGAMSVSARGVFTDPYSRLLFDVVFIDTPDFTNEEEIKTQLKSAIESNPAQVAAFIFEPLVLGSSGMKMYSAELLDELIGICAEHKVLTIADEVFTGFGRTGKMFATNYLTRTADIICLSKGITGGFMPFAATITKAFIYDAFYDDEKAKMLFHGHSYTGNPLGCAAALASLDVFEQEGTLDKIARIAQSHAVFAARMKNNAAFKDVRQRGTILALEFEDKQAGYLSTLRDRLYRFFIDKRIMLRPLGNVLYVLPPYCISESDLRVIYDAIEEFTALNS